MIVSSAKAPPSSEMLKALRLSLSKPPRRFRELAYTSRLGRWLIHRFGPAVWRLPPVLRRAMVLGGIARDQSSKSWEWRPAEDVRPAEIHDGPPTLGHRLSTKPFRLRPAKVHQLPKSWLVGKHAAAVTDGGRLMMGAFRDSARILGLERHQDLCDWMNARGWKRPMAGPVWSDVCSLVSRLDCNYYHWMVESCGQLEGLEAYERETGIQPKVLIRSGGPRYPRESLELLGVDSQRIIEWQPEEGPKPVERLVVVSRPGNEVACSPASLRWLQNRFLAAGGIEQPRAEKRLYIPRKVSGWRYAVNEDELWTALENEGFERVQPEAMTLTEQIRLFSRAAIIVGLHGAGLTNLLFAPHATVVELIGTYGGGEYYSMTSGLNQQWLFLKCKPVGENVLVDCNSLRSILEKLPVAAGAPT